MPSPLILPRQQKTAPVSLRRVTDVVQRAHAQALDVTAAGDLVALHCRTSRGTVVVTVALVDFLAAARGPRDANGRPWPVSRRTADLPAAPEPASAYTPPSPTGKITRAKLTPERQARIDAAARRIIASGEKAAPLAQEIGEPVSYLYKALGRLRMQGRPPVPKPSGKLL